jgi:hypothetical protein
MAVDRARLRVELVSPPDRSFLVAAVMCGNEQVAEVNVEQERMSIQLYRGSSGEPFQLDFAEFQHAIEEAGRRLSERTGRR